MESQRSLEFGTQNGIKTFFGFINQRTFLIDSRQVNSPCEFRIPTALGICNGGGQTCGIRNINIPVINAAQAPQFLVHFSFFIHFAICVRRFWLTIKRRTTDNKNTCLIVAEQICCKVCADTSEPPGDQVEATLLKWQWLALACPAEINWLQPWNPPATVAPGPFTILFLRLKFH